MPNDIDVLRQMYATLCGGIDDALTLLAEGNVWGAKADLQTALDIAEELYISGEQAEDELAERREREHRPERLSGK